ncbi:sigma-70 family RNA polymerase sigma factor [Conexibacter woesei]|uniref:sigma-70 family RNA polymerase sigma factor n=1 Tax=Conexibacter woesei TaxID=191495 RepID=UPI0018C944A9|nr:sigma-70 family RNA polymerase sigma factor [Conexibacter woesei]
MPAIPRLTEQQAQELVLTTVATHAEALLRVAYRHSLCADDAHDAYQRSMEILLRRAPTLDPKSAHKWLTVVVKREAMEVRRTRGEAVASGDFDYDNVASDASSPEERAMSADHATRAAEALKRLKPQELRALWLKALGHSYEEISALTGFSRTKVNRCLAEGRKAFLERYEGIESGEECERWAATLSAIVDGEATAAQLADVRPHLRNCTGCQATLRSLRDSTPPLRAVLPLGLVGATAKLSGLLDRVAGLADGAPAVAASGGLSVGGAKLAGLLAAGAVAVGGGTVAVESDHHAARAAGSPPTRAAALRRVTRTTATTPAINLPRRRVVVTTPSRHMTRSAAVRSHAAAFHRSTPAASNRDVELKPLGREVAVSESARARTAARTARNVPATASAKPSPPSTTDASGGEFVPNP